MWENFESGELDTKPDVVSYSSVINCWAKSRQEGTADRAEAIYGEMEDRYKAGDETFKPNVISYSSVINAYAKTGKAEKAEALLEEMYDAFVNGNESVKPNVRSFNTVLDAWSKSVRQRHHNEPNRFCLECANTLNQANSIQNPTL
jgi:pentatricopeptide repeat protein